MRQKMPTITESAAERRQRLQPAKDAKPRQRLQALYVMVSGHAQQRQTLAALVGVHRPRVAAWLDAYADGGLDKRRTYQVPRPPKRRRITPTALTALQASGKSRTALRAMPSGAYGWPSSLRCTGRLRGSMPWCGGHSALSLNAPDRHTPKKPRSHAPIPNHSPHGPPPAVGALPPRDPGQRVGPG